MTTKSMSYDHPAYTAVYGVVQECTGANGKSTKYGAFCAQLIKSVSGHVVLQGSSADILSLITITGTTTTTTALATAGSASPATGAAVTYPLSTVGGGGLLLNAGDAAYLVKGTDASIDWALSFEIVNQPLAPVTQ